MAAPITVTCPMPDCGWTSSIPIADDYPPSLINMLTGSARLVREHHISQHGALAWFEAWEKAAAAAAVPAVLTLPEDQAVRAVQQWMALDIHTALGKPTDYSADCQYQGHESWGDWWAQLVHDVRPPDPPRRGDHVEAWLKQQRDEHDPASSHWGALDLALDAYRLHADTGTPLDQHCCEGGNVDDCAGCYDDANPEPLVSDTEIQARLAQAHAEVERRREARDA